MLAAVKRDGRVQEPEQQADGQRENNMARNTLMRHRRSVLVKRDPNEGGGGGTGGDGTTGGEGANTGGNGGGNNSGEKLFTQAELDQKIGERLNRQKSQFSDYDQLKADSAELARLRKETESDRDKAVREAREEAQAEERKKSAPRVAGAEFRAAAKGVLSDAQLAAFLEDADLSKYLKDDGDADVDKITAKVNALAPASSESDKDKDTGRQRRHPDTGQGQREGAGKATVGSAREEYLERRRKQLGKS